jgi:hypothetical protein
MTKQVTTIVVDELRTYTGMGRLSGQWCHMLSDTGNLDELHAFAARLGLRRSWFQNKRFAPHYDLRPSKRALAVSLGAREVTWREIGHITLALANAVLPDPSERKQDE